MLFVLSSQEFGKVALILSIALHLQQIVLIQWYRGNGRHHHGKEEA